MVEENNTVQTNVSENTTPQFGQVNQDQIKAIVPEKVFAAFKKAKPKRRISTSSQANLSSV